MCKKRPELTSQFDVRQLQKQLRNGMQIHFDQSAIYGLLPLNVCVKTSHNKNR